jgi:pyridoxine 5-phosphate synthase
MATKLSVNVNKVATLRNTRALDIPSVTGVARLALLAGAHGITVHPRPDERHIRRKDVKDIAELLRSFPGVELNIEGNPFHGLVAFADEHRPAQCTLVPDDDAQKTSDHGWDLDRDAGRLQPIVAQLKAWGCRVSLFMDAEPGPMKLAREVGADRVELYTEPYAAACVASEGDRTHAVARFRRAADAARAEGLELNAGHDLSLANLAPFVAAVPWLMEVSIGHALIAEALELGLPETVRRYLAISGMAPPRRAP